MTMDWKKSGGFWWYMYEHFHKEKCDNGTFFLVRDRGLMVICPRWNQHSRRKSTSRRCNFLSGWPIFRGYVSSGVGGCTLQARRRSGILPRKGCSALENHPFNKKNVWKIILAILCDRKVGGSIKPWISKFFASCFGDNFDFCESFALFLVPFSKFDFQWRHKKLGVLSAVSTRSCVTFGVISGSAPELHLQFFSKAIFQNVFFGFPEYPKRCSAQSN